MNKYSYHPFERQSRLVLKHFHWCGKPEQFIGLYRKEWRPKLRIIYFLMGLNAQGVMMSAQVSPRIISLVAV